VYLRVNLSIMCTMSTMSEAIKMNYLLYIVRIAKQYQILINYCK
jgi:hypothetical protein